MCVVLDLAAPPCGCASWNALPPSRARLPLSDSTPRIGNFLCWAIGFAGVAVALRLLCT